ncbi:MAG: response regulator [bacterium]
MWIGTAGGLHVFAGESSRFADYDNGPDVPEGIIHGNVTSMLEDRFGVLWIGIDNDGLYTLDKPRERFRRFAHEPFNTASLADNRVISLYEDRAGVLWAGTYSRGVDRYDRYNAKFTPRHSRPDLAGDISDYVRGFLVDHEGMLWIATDGSGVIRHDRRTGTVTHFQHEPNNPRSLSNNRAFSLYEDRAGTLWVGASGGTLNAFNRADDTFARHVVDIAPETSLSPNNTRAMIEDRSGTFWVGVDGSGLFSFDPLTGTSTQYPLGNDDTEDHGINRVNSLVEDQSGNLWIGTFGSGVHKLNRETGTVVGYGHIQGDLNSLSNNQVMTIFEDHAGMIWIGSNGGGLDKLDPVTEIFVHYREDRGLPNNAIYAIVADEMGHFWLSHNKGLSRFDPLNETFRNYDVGDGLQSNEFNGGAYYRSPEGEMFFGGINGYNSFHPADILDNLEIPPVVITDLQLFNHSVPISDPSDGDAILTKSITETRELTLHHEDRVVSFEYAALLFGSAEKNEYAYMLEGLEDQWSYVGTRRFATYTHIPPGHYTFRVKASNGDGVWNEEGVALGIRIVPPFWKTAWFLILAVLSALVAVWGIHQYRTRLIRFRAKDLEQKVRERTMELECEIAERKEIEKQLASAHRTAVQATKSKSEFLATMSHEIRTPMNGVLGMAQFLLNSNDLSAVHRELATTIYSSGEALLTIINDILDFSKIEAGKLDIEPIPFDLQAVSSEVVDLLAPKAREKDLELVLRYAPGTPRQLIGDAGRLRQIILNLAGNAIKFTSTGYVLIDIEGRDVNDSDSLIKVSVQDTGIGMNEEALAKLFQPFSQADSSTTRKYGGTGLGLAISRQLVELMAGEIQVASSPGEGSTFWFFLRLPRAPHDDTVSIPAVNTSGIRVLVVDDLAIRQRVLNEQLTHLGMIPWAVTSGADALRELRKAAVAGNPIPIAVIECSLPDMNGKELGQAIKADDSLPDTVTILMTPTDHLQNEALLQDAGFSGYLAKPIRPDTFQMLLTEACVIRQQTQSAMNSFLTPHTVAEARAKKESRSTALSQPAAPGWQVLVAEDNIVNQLVARRVLENEGCVVDMAANGQEAVDMWSKQQYDAVFMDCQMPEMDGYAATIEIRNREGHDRHTLVIAMTANAMEGDRERCLAAGMDDYLAKPIRIDECRETVKNWYIRQQEDIPVS